MARGDLLQSKIRIATKVEVAKGWAEWVRATLDDKESCVVIDKVGVVKALRISTRFHLSRNEEDISFLIQRWTGVTTSLKDEVRKCSLCVPQSSKEAKFTRVSYSRWIGYFYGVVDKKGKIVEEGPMYRSDLALPALLSFWLHRYIFHGPPQESINPVTFTLGALLASKIALPLTQLYLGALYSWLDQCFHGYSPSLVEALGESFGNLALRDSKRFPKGLDKWKTIAMEALKQEYLKKKIALVNFILERSRYFNYKREGIDCEKKLKSSSEGSLSNTRTSLRVGVNSPQLEKKVCEVGLHLWIKKLKSSSFRNKWNLAEIQRAFTIPTLSIMARLTLSSKVARTHSAQPLATSTLVAILILLCNKLPLAIKAPSIVVITSRSSLVEHPSIVARRNIRGRKEVNSLTRWRSIRNNPSVMQKGVTFKLSESSVAPSFTSFTNSSISSASSSASCSSSHGLRGSQDPAARRVRPNTITCS
ncbi:PMD domain-containing protein [Senna tora]|uniref:PMD domain-containing protein n=1 Tax=Senna tora TaxID=362788 RepID=A0A834TLJ4_9FABA|nr:PMD domain-containing protein [Senna tora]